MPMRACPVMLALLLAASAAAQPRPADATQPWPRHTIDASSDGADGVRLGDVNGDGRPDVVTGWEEGGLVRVYLHPGPHAVREPWPAHTVTAVDDVEDAVFADLDGDGRLDVVSASEGDTRSIGFHLQKPGAALGWRRQAAPVPPQQWMFVLPADIDGAGPADLFVGSKNAGAEVGWLRAPATASNAWSYAALSPAGWIMSLISRDMDGDGDADLVVSDRRGELRGLRWLEHPGPEALGAGWRNHWIGGRRHEVMFMTLADVDGDGHEDALAAARSDTLLYIRRTAEGWEEQPIVVPAGTGTTKAVAAGDLDGDGRLDLVFTCEHAAGASGVMGLRQAGPPEAPRWEPFEIGGPAGTKFDRIELVDLDEDGDLDVLTCEETEGLGVIWYENPARRSASAE